MNNDEILLAVATNHPMALDMIIFNSFQKVPRQKQQHSVFTLAHTSDKICLEKYRFIRQDLYRLANLLQLPDEVELEHSKNCSGIEGLCILLRRLVYPNRLCDLEDEFGRVSSNLSSIINKMLQILWNKFSSKMTEYNHPWYDQERLQNYANGIAAIGSPLDRCFAFIDGMLRPVCRPKNRAVAEQLYTGHKKCYALKFQTVVIPSGLIANIYGPVPGRRHDSYALHESGLLQDLQQYRPYYIFGDQEYPLSESLIIPFKGGQRLPVEKRRFNKRMSSVRVSVEWPYAKVAQLFGYVDLKKNLKLFLQPVALYYLVACFFTNCHTCVNGNNVSSYFKLLPPTLEEYLHIEHDE